MKGSLPLPSWVRVGVRGSNQPVGRPHRGIPVSLALSAIALLSPVAVQADDEASRWYVGAGGGQSTGKQYCDAKPGVVVVNCDDTAGAVRLFTGYQITRYLGLEGGYLRLGQFTANRVVGGAAATDELKAYTGYLEGVARLPLGDRFGLFAKAGGLYWSIKTRGTLAGATVTDDTKGGFDFIAGAGVQFFFTRNLGVRAEYEFIPKLGNSATGEVDVGVVSASVIWKF
jgi:OOP family OmpA-OmpF porin